jgi:predicted DNA-binding transcriptional regulator YafY
LSERLEVTARTLRRDVDRLRSLGYPVHSTAGTAGGYQLGAGATLPPLLLDDEEAVAVAVGLRTASSGGVSGLEEASLRALAKLEQVLPARLRHRVTALHAAIVPMLPRGPAVDAKALSTIAAACRDQESLRFPYQSHDGTATARAVEPHRLVHTGRRWYLVAFDRGRADWRTFRVDRIGARLTTGARFAPRQPPDTDLAAYVSRAVSYAPYRYRASVLMFAPAEKIAEVIPPTVAVVEAVDTRSSIMHTGAQSLDHLCFWLAMIGIDFEVREPKELRDRVREIAGRFARASGERQMSEFR